MHQDVSQHNHSGQVREAPGKPFRGFDMQPLKFGEIHRAWKLTLVWKECKCVRLAGTAAFYGQGEEKALAGAACTSTVYNAKESDVSFEPK